MNPILLVMYVSAAVFVISVVSRFLKYKRLPLHLRWELYPVAHEKGRAHYGGSYLEQLEWWTKPRESTLLGELTVMIREILLLAGVWEHNRKHWIRSFPFHFGLYLLGGLIALLVVGAVLLEMGLQVSPDAGLGGRLLYHLTPVVGWAGLALASLGALALLARRVFNLDYREYTKKTDYFNLVFFIVTLVVSVIAQARSDPHFVQLREFFADAVTFDPSVTLGPLLGAEVVLGSLLVAYIPLTHMSHFFTKWFMYHDIRWSDEPAVRGGTIEKKVMEALEYPVSWSAPHIRGDGKKNWVDVATSPVQEDKPR